MRQFINFLSTPPKAKAVIPLGLIVLAAVFLGSWIADASIQRQDEAREPTLSIVSEATAMERKIDLDTFRMWLHWDEYKKFLEEMESEDVYRTSKVRP